jgi:uncharacterized protein (DUF58 family)
MSINLVEIEKAVAKIQGQLFKKANSHSIGAFKSSFRGSGLQFREHQIYHPGDDVRFIDWKLSAKSVGKTYVKTFEEDRNLEIIVFLDLSPSFILGYYEKSKLQMAIEVICFLFLITKITKDRVRLVLFEKNILEIPANTGKEGIILLISRLEKLGILDEVGQVKRGEEIHNTVESKKKIGLVKSFVARRKEVIYLTDFFDKESKGPLEKLSYSANFHCFELITPFEYADSQPFSFLSKSKEFFYRKKGETRQKKKQVRIKQLDVSKNYLEQFIGQMK